MSLFRFRRVALKRILSARLFEPCVFIRFVWILRNFVFKLLFGEETRFLCFWATWVARSLSRFAILFEGGIYIT
jgi:hypothetical protein